MSKATIYYHDIGDYLDRSEKLAIIKEFGSVMNPKIQWEKITPNEKHDWINQRDGTFDEMILIGDKDDKQNERTFFVPNYSRGMATGQDVRLTNFSRLVLKRNVIDAINELNSVVEANGKNSNEIENIIKNISVHKVSWTDELKALCKRNFIFENFKDDCIVDYAYRPFCKFFIYNYKPLITRTYQIPKLFPTPEAKNLVICTKGIGDKDFSCFITDCVPDLQLNFNGQCFPLYYYEPVNSQLSTVNCPELPLFDSAEIPDAGSVSSQPSTKNSQLPTKNYVRKDAITDWILSEVRRRFPTSGKSITKEHIFYYVYGILHSKQYRERFASDLKKSLPRIPIVDDINTFMDFYNAGKRLADLHLNYEKVCAYDGVTLETIKPVVYAIPNEKPKLDLDYGELMAAEPSPKFKNDFDEYQYYAVEKMRFPQKGQKDTIIYNHYITIKNIPAKAYDYIVNGKSAIEWIMERYCVSTDKASGIKNDCNDWAREHEKPRYVLDLLFSVINVSVQTAEIVEGLPKVEW